MRKLKLFLSLLMLFAFSLGNVWATEVKWPGTTALPGTATSIEGDDNVTIMTSSTNTYSNPIRVYANTTITIKVASGYTIESVTYEASSTGGYVTSAQNATVTPSVTPSVSDKNVTWSFTDATSTFTFTPSAQTRSNRITVVYSSTGGDEPGEEPGDEPAPTTSDWEKVDVADLETGDVVVIVKDDELALSQEAASQGGPSAVPVIVSENKLSATPVAAIQWEVTVTENSYQFAVPETSNYLYCTNTNNGVRIGTNTGNVFTISTEGYLYNTATSRYVGVYNSIDWRCYTSINNNIKNQTFSFFKKSDGTPQKEAAGLTFETSAYLIKANGSLATPTLTNPNSLSVTYTSSNTDVAEVNASTGAVTIKAAGKAEITASSEETETFKAGSAKYTIYVANHLGTEEDPYEVADARMAIDWNAYITNVYAKGIVSEIVEAYSSQYGNITYNISTDGTTTADQLQAYRGKGQNGDNFTSADDVQVGDEVVLYGTLKKYNSTYEFDANNQLVSLNRDKQAAGISYATTAFIVKKGAEFTAPALVNPNTLAVTYSSDAAWAVVDATTGVLTLNATEGKATITASFEGNASYNAGSAKYSIYFTDHAGTAEDPLTVAEAREVIDNLETIAGVYVAGKVSEIVTAYSEQYGNISYNISTDGTTITDQLQAYRGKAANGENFTSADDVQVGDEVVVYGNLKKYNSTYEFDANNQLYSLNRPTTPEEPVVSEWAEIKFAEAVAADALAADATFTAENSEFALTITDNNNKMSIDGNNANFGTADAYDTYSHRLKAGGTSSASNNMTLTIPADGTLRIAVRSASGDATTRNLVLTQNETELYNAIVKDADAVLLADETTKVYPYVTLNVKAGSVNITYPNGGLNFYSFAFKEGASEDPVEPEPVVGNKYKKVTATSDITNGKYLIVYEEGSLAFNGGLETLDAASNTIAVEIANDRIAATDATNAAAFTIAATAGTIKSANGLYIGQTSDANGMAAQAGELTNTISIDEEGNAVILASGGAYLRFNATSGQERFRYFKSSTYTNQKTIALYKLVQEEEIPEWAEIVFPEAKEKDELAADADFTLSYSDFKLTLSDLGNSVSIDLPSSAAKFGTAEDGNEYTGRLKTGGSSNSMTLTIPADGLLRIAVRSANSTDNDRTLVLAQGEETLYSKVVKDADKSEDGYYPYVFVNVKAGTVSVTYPDGGLNFYAFAFNEGASIDVEPEEPETPATTKNVVILAEYNSKFYAMSTTINNETAIAIEVEKDGDNIVVANENDKAAIQWTMTTNGTTATFQKEEQFLYGASGGATLALKATECIWTWDNDYNCYATEGRGFFYRESGNGFKNYSLSTNLGKTGYSGAPEIIEIDPANIVVTTKVDPELAFNPEEVTLTVGDAFVAPVLGSVEGFDGLAAVTYASNNEALATVEADGTVSLMADAIGTATITATFAGNSNYLPGSASYTITVNEVGDDLSGNWVLATAVPAVGQKVIIAATYQNETKAMGIQNSNNRAAVASTLEDDVLTPGAGTKVFTLVDAGDGKFAIQASNGNYLSAAGTGTSNYLKEAENFDEDNAKWTITIENGEANIVASSNNRNVLRYNSGNTIFSCYQSGAQRAINIYVQDTYTRALEPNRYYTVCLPKKMMEVRGASFWTLSSRNTAETEAYLEEVDPTTAEAGTPFIIQATDTKLEVVYTGAATTTAGTNGALHGTLTYMDADALAAAGTNIYMLYNNALRPVGTNNHLDANRAYINYNELNPVTEAPQPAPGRRVRAVPMQQNTATGIDELNGSEAPAKVLINGQLFILRGEKMYDAKGLLVK